MNAVADTPAVATRFTDNGDGTITYTTTGLMWSKATLRDDEVTQQQAAEICSELDLAGHTDWRLPTVEELFALADRARQDPAIDTDAFPDTRSDWYWTSTETAWSSARAWIVDFYNGGAGSSRRDYDFGFVRAVREVQP